MTRDAASQRQVDAADPRQSTWLSANAGSGKTRVLTDRVARLLLEGVAPQNILCLTYTKAAAAEMQNRLFQRLGAWAMKDDQALNDDLSGLGVAGVIDAQGLAQARTLFARAIETPGGLKIQTIHAFCAGVLRRFPLEAGVSPQFREIEDQEAKMIRAEVLDQMIEGTHADTVRALLRYFTGDDLTKLTGDIVRQRDHFDNPPDDATLRQLLHIGPGVTVDRLFDDIFDPGLLRSVAQVCAGSGPNDQKLAQSLDAVLQDPTNRHATLATLERVFLTGKTANPPFTAKIDKIPTKAIREANPDLIADLNPVMQRIEDARSERLGLLILDRTRTLLEFAARFIPAYEARKLALGALDFDDLIRKTRALLTSRDLAQWVLFRLDGGIDHILVDEAQDTSPTQWAVIERLTEEFASGEGSQPDRERTVFVVGDKKQSIYSFQGADPQAFDAMQHHFKARQTAIDRRLEITSLDHSFRSSAAILSVVDATLDTVGMDVDGAHIAFHADLPGRVDLWPVIEPSKAEETRVWYQPVDLPSPMDHIGQLAEQIANSIKHIIATEKLPDFKDGQMIRRAITPGDFLILVQSRSTLFSEVIRACKTAGLDIAGADRLRVGGELAVKDLCAVLRFLALPEDDLSLAAALRSPLFGWSEQQLYSLAHHRPAGSYLWEALRNSDNPETLACLDDLRRNADFLRPYDLIARLLTRHEGRQKLLARLGAEAEDGIDALLSQALNYESTGIPSLTGFLVWMDSDTLEIKRQVDNQTDQIRVMTVHGAKGLEAPIVILPDCAKRKNEVKDDLLKADDHIIWKPKADDAPPVALDWLNRVKDSQTRERERLLYVAMTRAEKWLIIAAAGDTGRDMDSWYSTVETAMETRAAVQAGFADLTVTRVEHGDWTGLPPLTDPDDPPPAVPPAILDPMPDISVPRILSPSDLPGAKVLPGEVDSDTQQAAMDRGTQMHLLLEYLPQVAEGDRLKLGRSIVGSGADAMIEDACRLIRDPALAEIWTPQALVEVDITADIPGLGRVLGTIDRLLVDDDRVLIVDYKTNRLVPDHPAKTPLGLLRQLAVYAHAISQLYPDHRTQAAILWTGTQELMILPDDLLHDSLKDLSPA